MKYPVSITIKDKIFEMTRAKHKNSSIYKDSLRAMIASFNEVSYLSSEDKIIQVKCLQC